MYRPLTLVTHTHTHTHLSTHHASARSFDGAGYGFGGGYGQSFGAPGLVHVSATTHELVKDMFASVCLGEQQIKGKGMMKTCAVASSRQQVAGSK